MQIGILSFGLFLMERTMGLFKTLVHAFLIVAVFNVTQPFVTQLALMYVPANASLLFTSAVWFLVSLGVLWCVISIHEVLFKLPR